MKNNNEMNECEKEFKREVYGVFIATSLLMMCVFFIYYIAK